mmetsp:Transcript_79025/g.218731  ORF Transcript_79025/g.218731 Transcript_79025/m.218731 type:complete len:225 (-) Transcript_79025:1185-1859(-)
MGGESVHAGVHGSFESTRARGLPAGRRRALSGQLLHGRSPCCLPRLQDTWYLPAMCRAGKTGGNRLGYSIFRAADSRDGGTNINNDSAPNDNHDNGSTNDNSSDHSTKVDTNNHSTNDDSNDNGTNDNGTNDISTGIDHSNDNDCSTNGVGHLHACDILRASTCCTQERVCSKCQRPRCRTHSRALPLLLLGHDAAQPGGEAAYSPGSEEAEHFRLRRVGGFEQ